MAFKHNSDLNRIYCAQAKLQYPVIVWENLVLLASSLPGPHAKCDKNSALNRLIKK